MHFGLITKLKLIVFPGKQLIFGPKSNPLPLKRIEEGLGSRRKIWQKKFRGGQHLKYDTQENITASGG